MLLFHVAWTFYYHVCKHTYVGLQYLISSLNFLFTLLCCAAPMDLDSLIQSFTKFSISFGEIFSCKDWKVLNCSLMLKVTFFFSSTILKYWRDLISLEVLKNAPVTPPTHDNALGGWYIYRQPTIIVFRAGLYRQQLLKFSRAGNYRYARHSEWKNLKI